MCFLVYRNSQIKKNLTCNVLELLKTVLLKLDCILHYEINMRLWRQVVNDYDSNMMRFCVKNTKNRELNDILNCQMDRI